jgi:dihydrofolate synthase/folylpolyglutamate synthase
MARPERARNPRAAAVPTPEAAPLRDALRDLYARVPLGARLDLGPMRAACARFGHPERAFDAVHVAGTNGKGSTCALVESVARACGKRTGMYTSPHLCRFAERIRVGGAPLDDDALVDVLGGVLRLAPELSFFETATLAAFVAFREAKVDVAIVEVGLGGRLDATNVLPSPCAAAITRIAFDHMDRLGATLEAIAREKAGIAKPGLDVLLGGGMPAPVRAAIDEVCRDAGATTSCVDDDPSLREAVAGLAVRVAPYAPLDLAYALGRRVGATDEACRRGLASAVWPGRYESVRSDAGVVLLDAAHNPDGTEALVRAVATSGVPGVAKGAPRALVFGALADKASAEMLAILAPAFERRVYVAPPIVGFAGRGPTDPHDLARAHGGTVAPTVARALELARGQVGASGLVVVCGSIFLVGEARALLMGLERDPPVAL